MLRDFVELPSQIFEHWLSEPEVLKRHARHYATHEPIPDALVERLHAARFFNQGYETVRYTASALVDMAAHRLDAVGADSTSSRSNATSSQRIGLPDGVGMNHRLPHFQHLFAGSGYAAGYYVYLWAEVLDADGYEAFAEAGDPFDPEVAARLRRFIYSAGDSLEPSAGVPGVSRPHAADRADAAPARPARGRDLSGSAARFRLGDLEDELAEVLAVEELQQRSGKFSRPRDDVLAALHAARPSGSPPSRRSRPGSGRA